MNIENTRALIPVQGIIQPVIGIEQKGIKHFRNHDHHQDGIIYMGFGLNDDDKTYGRTGKKIEDLPTSGGIVDIYV